MMDPPPCLPSLGGVVDDHFRFEVGGEKRKRAPSLPGPSEAKRQKLPVRPMPTIRPSFDFTLPLAGLRSSSVPLPTARALDSPPAVDSSSLKRDLETALNVLLVPVLEKGTDEWTFEASSLAASESIRSLFETLVSQLEKSREEACKWKSVGEGTTRRIDDLERSFNDFKREMHRSPHPLAFPTLPPSAEDVGLPDTLDEKEEDTAIQLAKINRLKVEFSAHRTSRADYPSTAAARPHTRDPYAAYRPKKDFPHRSPLAAPSTLSEIARLKGEVAALQRASAILQAKVKDRDSELIAHQRRAFALGANPAGPSLPSRPNTGDKARTGDAGRRGKGVLAEAMAKGGQKDGGKAKLEKHQG
ncbi:hypothetical protein P7C73_g5468, partial [Tremellales sp. Uapishka_1]